MWEITNPQPNLTIILSNNIRIIEYIGYSYLIYAKSERYAKIENYVDYWTHIKVRKVRKDV